MYASRVETEIGHGCRHCVTELRLPISYCVVTWRRLALPSAWHHGGLCQLQVCGDECRYTADVHMNVLETAWHRSLDEPLPQSVSNRPSCQRRHFLTRRDTACGRLWTWPHVNERSYYELMPVAVGALTRLGNLFVHASAKPVTITSRTIL